MLALCFRTLKRVNLNTGLLLLGVLVCFSVFPDCFAGREVKVWRDEAAQTSVGLQLLIESDKRVCAGGNVVGRRGREA